MRASDPDFARMRPSPVPFPIAARRYDVGEAANFALMPMAVAALRQLLDWGVAETQATLRTITRLLHMIALSPKRFSDFRSILKPQNPVPVPLRQSFHHWARAKLMNFTGTIFIFLLRIAVLTNSPLNLVSMMTKDQ